MSRRQSAVVLSYCQDWCLYLKTKADCIGNAVSVCCSVTVKKVLVHIRDVSRIHYKLYNLDRVLSRPVPRKNVFRCGYIKPHGQKIYSKERNLPFYTRGYSNTFALLTISVCSRYIMNTLAYGTLISYVFLILTHQ
jgi:hypothetical protein